MTYRIFTSARNLLVYLFVAASSLLGILDKVDRIKTATIIDGDRPISEPPT
jgi:hypothetical protein